MDEQAKINKDTVTKLKSIDKVLENIDIKVIEVGSCRMDLPGPTTSVGTRTDYSVGPWD
jgi:hypothetical protein